MKTLNVEKSRELTNQIFAEKKACWKNSLLALFSIDELDAYVYVEGWVFDVIPFAHGWLENDDEIIDVTLVLQERDLSEVKYFAGATYKKEELNKFWNKRLPLVESDGRGGFSHEAYLNAYKAALKAALDASE